MFKRVFKRGIRALLSALLGGAAANYSDNPAVGPCVTAAAMMLDKLVREKLFPEKPANGH